MVAGTLAAAVPAAGMLVAPQAVVPVAAAEVRQNLLLLWCAHLAALRQQVSGRSQVRSRFLSFRVRHRGKRYRILLRTYRCTPAIGR